MYIHRNFITILIFLSVVCTLSSQEKKWSLNECIGYAIENNLQIKDFRYNEQTGNENYRQTIRDLLPSANASTVYIRNFGRSTDPFTNDVITTDFFSNQFNIDFSVDLFQGFQKINNLKASKFLYQAFQEETKQQKYLLGFRVLQAFYDIQFFEGLLTIFKEQLALSQTNYNLVQKQIDLGLKAGADLYEVESQRLADTLNVVQSENQLSSARLRLVQEMNLANTNDIKIQTELAEGYSKFKDVNLQTDAIFNIARNFIPLIKSQELRKEASKKQLAVTKGAYYPTLSLFGGLGTGVFETTTNSMGVTIPFNEQFRDNSFQFIGGALNIPFSESWQNGPKVELRKIEILRAQNNLEIQEQELYQTIQTLVLDYNSLLVEIEQSDQKMLARSLAFKIAQKRYEKGLISVIELTTAKNLLANAQNENLQVRIKSQINKITLDFYQGLPVFNIN